MGARCVTLLTCVSNRRKPGFAGYEGRPAELSRYPNRRAGRNRIARRSANRASNVSATTRNGSDRSHKRGQRTMTRTASGQHNTNRRHQPTIASNAFTGLSPRFLGATLAYPRNGQVTENPYLPVCNNTLPSEWAPRIFDGTIEFTLLHCERQ